MGVIGVVLPIGVVAASVDVNKGGVAANATLECEWFPGKWILEPFAPKFLGEFGYLGWFRAPSLNVGCVKNKMLAEPSTAHRLIVGRTPIGARKGDGFTKALSNLIEHHQCLDDIGP
jgi:hypothetical protein